MIKLASDQKAKSGIGTTGTGTFSGKKSNS